MFGSFVLAVSSLATTLLPFPADLTHTRGPANARPLPMDRLSITKRIIEAHSRLKRAKIVLKPSVVSQTFHYRSIRMVNCPGYCYASDINNLGQVSVFSNNNPPLAPGVVDADNNFHALSGLLSNDRPYVGARAVALNDFGGVAGNYYGGSNIGEGNLIWQLQNGAYNGLYFDGRISGLQAYAINDYDISVGYNSAYPPLPEIYSQFIPRHELLGLNEPPCAGAFGYATGINDANTIVGYGGTCEGEEALRFSPYRYAERILPLSLSREGSSAAAVNQDDDIVGFYGYASGAYLYQAASNRTTLLPTRPEWDTDGAIDGLGVNASDQVIGDYEELEEPYYYTGWLYTGGKTYDLNAVLPQNSGWLIHTAIAINNAGQIVGQGDYTDPVTGVMYGNAVFVMTP